MRLGGGSAGEVSIAQGGNTAVVETAGQDAAAKTIDALGAYARIMGFNGATWDRVRSEGQDRDAIAAETLGYLQSIGFPHAFNGTTWDRQRSEGTDRDAIAAAALGYIQSIGFGHGFNGTTWDRNRNAGFSGALRGAQMVSQVPNPVVVRDVTSNDAIKTFTVPTNATWQIKSIEIMYLATGTVGNRDLIVFVRDASDNQLLRLELPFYIVANNAFRIFYLPGGPLQTAVVDNLLFYPLPVDLILGSGWDLLIQDNGGIDVAADDMLVNIIVDERQG